MRKNNVIIAGLMMLLVLSGSLAAGNGGKNPQKGYDRLWNTFAGCLEKDLPELAAQALDSIEQKALKENNQTQLLKSWKAHGILLSFSTDDVWQQNYIRYLEARTGRLDTLYEAVLQMTLAEAYASLLFTYEWIIDKNMPVDGDISETDMIYWDKGSFISRINAHFAEAMKPVGALKRAMTADYLISFKKSSTDEIPDLTYEKTMFEYILHRVANCYGMIYIYDDDMEAGLVDEAWWLPAEDFVKIDLDGNADNHLIKCLKIYQELIAYSLKNENVEALIYNDIRRFDVVNILSPDYEKAQKALSDLRIRHAGHPLSAEIAALMAKEMVQKQNDSYVKDSTYYFNYRDAKTLCEEAMAQFPKSEGAEKCRKIIVGIERQRIEISMNEVQLPGEPIPAVLEYLNVPTFCYRIVKVSEKEFEKFEEWAWKNPKGYEKRLRKIASKKAFIEQEISLPAETDYCAHTTMIALPALECGHYYLLGRAGKGNKNAVLFDFQVSELAYVADYKNDSSMTVAIMNRRTGLPEAGVTVECYRRIWDYKSDMYKTVPIGTFLSDSQGLVMLDGKRCPGNFQFNLRRGNDILLSSDGDFHLAGTYDLLEDEVIEVEEEVVEYEEEADIRDGHIHTTLLTDRAIYRLGQTVYFQGVVTRSTGDKEILMAGYSEKVSLKANWRAIDSAEFVTDEYGSFSGSFVIPTGMGNCRFQLHTGHGFDDVRVEEYKRPTFEVTFDKPDGQYKLNEEVTLHGDVKAFAGFGLDDVEYSYRVVRKTSFPWRCGWNWYPEGISDKQIAQGKSRTDEDGKFAITFNLKPSQDIAPERQPLFTYEMEVTATSRQGETHIGRYSIRVGYNEVALSCDLPSEVEQNDIGKYRISADNPDGRPVKSRVSRRIYRYDTPTKCSYFTELRNSRQLRYPAILDRQLLSDAELDSLFPVFTFYEKQNKTLVYEDELLVDGTAPLSAGKKLEAGKYMLELMSPDDSLSVITKDFVVYENGSHKMPYPVMQWVKSDQDSVHPGEELSFRIGSCATGAVVWLQLVHENEIRMEKWIRLDNEVQFFTYRVTEQDRGGLSLKTALVKENMTQCYKKEIVVPYDNYNLDVSLATVRDQLTPGAEEKWEVTVRDYKDKPLEASLLSGMYDASLERFTAHRWNFDLKPQNVVSKKFFKDDFEFLEHSDVEYFYDIYYLDIFRFNLPSNNPLMAYWEEGVSPAISGDMSFLPPPPSAEMSLGCCEMYECAEAVEREASAGCFRFDFEDSDDGQEDSGQPSEPTLRENFNETAFFFPQLRTNADGSATFSFTMPDALTRWKLMLLAYTKERQTGYKEYTFTSSKPVMIMADMPRYMYDNDTIWMVANVINTGDEAVTPKAKLEIFDAATMQPLNLLLSAAEIPMETILPGRSHEVRWKVAARHDLGLIAFRFTAYAGTFSDAEQRLLPVLCSEVFMTQTLPFTVKAGTEQTFDFDAIANPNSNERDHSLTLNFSSNPVWYAVQSLPYLANTKTDNAENAFYVFYANTLSSYIASKIPNLLNYIKKWQIETPEALQSQLEKDQELKAIMLKETPWVLEAKSESEQRSRLAALFEVNTLRNRQGNALKLISDKQQYSGGWSWRDGMPESPFISTNILAGFGRLQQMGALESLGQDERNRVQNICNKAVRYLEQQVAEEYRNMKKNSDGKDWPIGSLTLNELYALSFFAEQNSDKDFATAKKYWLGSLDKEWTSFNFNQRAKAALVLQRSGNAKTAQLMIKSFKECAQKNEQIGIYWPKKYCSFESHIATHANIMAAFAEIAPDNETMDRLRVWLLTQKQTNRWENSASTADALYALLLRGTDWFEEGREVTLRFGNTPVSTEGGVAGTGFIQKRWNANEVTPEMRRLTVNNPTGHLVWSGLFRQYFVPIDEVRGDESGFTIRRELFVEKVTEQGKVLVPIGSTLRQAQGAALRQAQGANAVPEPVEGTASLKVGDKVTVKITFENKQDMSYVFVKDLRAAGFEPLEQVSRYRSNDRMWYYQTNTDTDMEFFIEHLSKGIHQLEYSMFVTKEGVLNNGYSLIQCQYAPEFTACSNGMKVKVERNEP